VDPGSNLDAERGELATQFLRAADRSDRAVEGREHTIACVLHQDPTCGIDVLAHSRVVVVEQLMPSAVSH